MLAKEATSFLVTFSCCFLLLVDDSLQLASELFLHSANWRGNDVSKLLLDLVRGIEISEHGLQLDKVLSLGCFGDFYDSVEVDGVVVVGCF